VATVQESFNQFPALRLSFLASQPAPCYFDQPCARVYDKVHTTGGTHSHAHTAREKKRSPPRHTIRIFRRVLSASSSLPPALLRPPCLLRAARTAESQVPSSHQRQCITHRSTAAGEPLPSPLRCRFFFFVFSGEGRELPVASTKLVSDANGHGSRPTTHPCAVG